MSMNFYDEDGNLRVSISDDGSASFSTVNLAVAAADLGYPPATFWGIGLGDVGPLDMIEFGHDDCPYCGAEWEESKYHPGTCVHCGAKPR